MIRHANKIRQATTHKVHCRLMDKGGWYCNWHQRPKHKHVHVGLFVVYFLGIITGAILYTLGYFGLPTSAASNAYDFTTASNYILSDSATSQITAGKAELTIQPYIADGNTVALYHLDEGSADFTDSSGNGLTLTKKNTVTYSSATHNSAFGTSIDFGVNGRGELQDNLFALTGPITVEAWVKRNIDAGAEQVIAGLWRDSTDQRAYDLVIDTNDKLAFKVSSDGTAGTVTTITSAATINVGTWYHVAGTYDNTNLNLYIDGVSAASAVAFAGPIHASTEKFQIARDKNGGNELQGNLDEVRVSDVARTSFNGYTASKPTVRPNISNATTYATLSGFTTTEVLNGGSIKYRITNDGTNASPTWYYWNGTNWVTATAGTHYNDAATINTNIAQFVTDVGTGDFSFLAYLISDGTQLVQLDDVALTYEPATPPVATTPASISQLTDGSGHITFQTTISDVNLDTTRVKVEYSEDGGSTWFDPDLVSATPSTGTVDLDDAQTYQIGTVDAIDTNSGAKTLTIVWDTKSATNGNGSLDNTSQSDIQVRVIPNDNSSNGLAETSASFSLDNVKPVLAEVTAVPTPGNDATPDYTFSSDEAGTITYGGACSSATTNATASNNTITFNSLADGAHSNCTVTVTDAAGNASSALAVTAFTIDATAPVVTEVTAVPTGTTDSTPDYTFNTDEAGTITYGGSCSSATTNATVGNNTITFNTLTDGTYSNCTITVTDVLANVSTALAVSTFTVDTVAPTITQVTPVLTPANDPTPAYTFNSDEVGTISYGGSCSSATTSASVGNNTVIFNSLVDGTYTDCTITVNDVAGTASNVLAVPSFTIETVAPVLAEVTPVTTPGNDATPDYTFSTDEAGTISYGGDCSSLTTNATAGNNTITFNTLADGTRSNCTVTVTDSLGNTSNALSVTAFTIDTVAPSLGEVTAVPTPANDTTPDYTFSSNEAGTITYGGACSSTITNAASGNNIITFDALTDGTYSNCTVTVTDMAGNASSAQAVTAFTVDTVAPVAAEVTAVTTPTNDTTPNYTFSSDEVGTITYGGSCSSLTTNATVGNNTITLAALPDGTYSNCTVAVTDAAGNIGNTVNITSFTIDTAVPVVTEVTAVPNPGNDLTPSYTFSTSKAGTITYGGSCSSATTNATAGNNTITFNALTVGTYADCTIQVTDVALNPSNVLAVSSFTIETTAPVISEVTPVTTPTADNTPNYTFTTDEAGTITYGGDCTSATTNASVGNNTVIFNTLIDGIHSNCTITVSDAATNVSNQILVTSFTVDTGAPILAEVTAVPTLGNDSTPDYTFSSDEAGTITYGGSCSSAITNAVAGNNTITFNNLTDGTYTNCIITVTDNLNFVSAPLNVSSFTIETVSPAVAEVTAVPDPTVIGNPNYTFSTDEAGTITYGGSCSSATTNATVGNNVITLNGLANGTFTDCVITVTDAAGNASTALNMSAFTVDSSSPTLSEVTAVSLLTNDATPEYSFSSTEAGTISYGGSCSSAITNAVAGNNTIIFNTLADGTYNDCTITVTDTAGNPSSNLAVTAFTVDATAPTVTETTAIPNSIDTTPSYTFNTTEAGPITYGGSCSTSSTTATVGNNTITFNALSLGTYSNCSITVTDIAGNGGLVNVSPFTIISSGGAVILINEQSTPTSSSPAPTPTPTSLVDEKIPVAPTESRQVEALSPDQDTTTNGPEEVKEEEAVTPATFELVSVDGGSVSHSNTNSSITVSVPSGTFTQAANVSINPALTTDIEGTISGFSPIPGNLYDLNASIDGMQITTFENPLELVFTYSNEQVAFFDENSLQIGYYNETFGRWEAVPGLIDPINNTITVDTTHFSMFGLFGILQEVLPGNINLETPVDSVVPAGFELTSGVLPEVFTDKSALDKHSSDGLVGNAYQITVRDSLGQPQDVAFTQPLKISFSFDPQDLHDRRIDLRKLRIVRYYKQTRTWFPYEPMFEGDGITSLYVTRPGVYALELSKEVNKWSSDNMSNIYVERGTTRSGRALIIDSIPEQFTAGLSSKFKSRLGKAYQLVTMDTGGGGRAVTRGQFNKYVYVTIKYAKELADNINKVVLARYNRDIGLWVEIPALHNMEVGSFRVQMPDLGILGIFEKK